MALRVGWVSENPNREKQGADDFLAAGGTVEDLERFCREFDENVLSADDWPVLADEAYYGLAGEMVTAIGPHTEGHPVALLGTFLAEVGNVIGRGAFWRIEDDTHYCKVWPVAVGESSKARKGVSQGRTDALMKRAAPEWADACLETGLSSGEGLINRVRDPLYKETEDGPEEGGGPAPRRAARQSPAPLSRCREACQDVRAQVGRAADVSPEGEEIQVGQEVPVVRERANPHVFHPGGEDGPNVLERAQHTEPPEGRALVVADYSQIELLLAAVIAPEPAMLRSLKGGEDLHTKTAKSMLRGKEVSPEELKAYRRRAKAVNFSFLYGMQAKSFVRYARAKYDLEVSLEEAESYKKAFFATFPGLTHWHARERKKANAGRDLVRTPLGRMRKVSLAYRPWRKGWAPYFPERVNAPVQGAGADAIKAALALLYETRREQPGDPFPVDVVHDEIVLEVAAEYAERAEAWVSECLMRGARQVTEVPDLPVKVETRIVESFGEK